MNDTIGNIIWDLLSNYESGIYWFSSSLGKWRIARIEYIEVISKDRVFIEVNGIKLPKPPSRKGVQNLDRFHFCMVKTLQMTGQGIKMEYFCWRTFLTVPYLDPKLLILAYLNTFLPSQDFTKSISKRKLVSFVIKKFLPPVPSPWCLQSFPFVFTIV